MQSINTGFNSLRTMLPKHEGEKLSKAAILQHTAEYIDSLEQEKTRLLSQLHQLKTLIKSVSNGQQDISELAKHSLVKKIKTEHNSEFNSDSSDEGIHCNVSPIEAFDNVDELKAELIEVRKTVDRERKLRMSLEDQVKALETQLYPERVREIAQSIQVKGHSSRHHSSSLHASASETGSLDNSENENELAVASLQDDVIAETIEIETGSCPGSPLTSIGSHQTIVIQQPTSSSNGTSIGSLTPQVIHLDASALRVVAASTGKSMSGKSSGQPGAIALPIEVPFMGTIVTASPATISKTSNTTTTTIHVTSNSSKGSTLTSNTSNILGVASSTASGKSAGTGGTVAARVSSVIVSNNNTNSGSSSNSGSNSSTSGTNNTNSNTTNSSSSNANANSSSNSNVSNNGNNSTNSSSSNSNNSSSSNNNTSSNVKSEPGKISNTNGNVANSDGKSVCNSNSNSNKSSASTISSSSKQSKQAASLPPRHNLETIVEAIRHLEGDHMFKDDDSVAIEVEETVVPLIE